MSENIEVTKEMIIQTLERVVTKNQEEFIIMGSTALTAGLGNKFPLNLRLTSDIDLIPAEIGQTSPEELKKFNLLKENIRVEFGKDSSFEKEQGFEVSLVPKALLLNAPNNWQERCLSIDLPSNHKVSVLAPHDLACAKLIAGREKDIEWLAVAIESKAIEIPKLAQRLETCNPGMLKAKEEGIKNVWLQVHTELKSRGIPCWKDIFPNLEKSQGKEQGV